MVQDGVHLLCDRHFDASGLSQADCGGSGENPFGDHPVHSGNDFVQLAAVAQFDADATIARQASGAGKY